VLTRHIPAALRRLVVRRAESRCEYCRLHQAGQAATFHIDHIVPAVAGGPTGADNLALACVGCSLHKAARQLVTDPETGQDVPVYNPRCQPWDEHFAWEGVRLAGLTPTGRGTVAALRMNRPTMLAIRAEEAERGRHL